LFKLPLFVSLIFPLLLFFPLEVESADLEGCTDSVESPVSTDDENLMVYVDAMNCEVSAEDVLLEKKGRQTSGVLWRMWELLKRGKHVGG
jgi:hypothetical protein